MILVHVAFFGNFKMCKGLDGQEVCHSLRFYSMFLECNNIRARLRPNEFSGRRLHSFTVASFDRSFHTTCRVSMCEYHQCCGFGWAASISFVEIPATTLRYWQCCRCCIKLTIYRLWKVLCRFWEILGNAFYVDLDRHYPCKSRLLARLWRPASPWACRQHCDTWGSFSWTAAGFLDVKSLNERPKKILLETCRSLKRPLNLWCLCCGR